MMRPDLSPDPNQETQLLLRIIASSLNPTAVSALPPLPPPQSSPSRMTIWIQCLLCASLICSLFAALGAVMGKQWLDHYKSIGERGTVEARGMERQRKFVALQSWHFRTILEVLPVLLQMSLLLFAVALSAYMWGVNQTVAMVLIVTNSLGFFMYFVSIIASLLFPDCPYQSSLSTTARQFTKVLRTSPFSVQRLARELGTRLSSLYHGIPHALTRIHLWLSCAVIVISLRVVQLWELIRSLVKNVLSRLRDTPIQPVSDADLEMLHPPSDNDEHGGVVEKLQQRHRNVISELNSGRLVLPSVSSEEDIAAWAVVWITETSTDPFVLADAMQVVPEISWSSDALNRLSPDILDFLLRGSIGVVSPHQLDPSGQHSWDRATSFNVSFLHLFWEKFLANPQDTTSSLERWISRHLALYHDDFDSIVEQYLPYRVRTTELHPWNIPYLLVILHLTSAMGEFPKKPPVLTFTYQARAGTLVVDTETVCARALLFLGQVTPITDTSGRPRRYFTRLLISCCRHARTHEQKILYLLAFAVLCGYGNDEARQQPTRIYDMK